MQHVRYFLVMFLSISLIGFAQSRAGSDQNVYSGTLHFGLDGGATWAITDYDRVKPNIMGRGYVDYYFPTSSSGMVGLRGFVNSGYIGGQYGPKPPTIFRTQISSVGGGVLFALSVKEVIIPYLFAGISYTWFSPQDTDGNQLPGSAAQAYDRNEVNFHSDMGMKFLLTKSLALNFDIGFQLSPNDYWDDVKVGNVNDLMFTTTLGFSYALFTKDDSDNDGVIDSKDQCPDTPPNVEVDEFGCPEDSDNDGVPDYLDECPNTEPGVEVDEEGCALDSDNDGVPDHKDKCPNTRAGQIVNEFGCPDSDNDGVPDNLDECPDTPEGAPVDSKGCPLDSDNDGVPDYMDECPNTPAGQQVDSKGCATVTEKIKQFTLSGDTNFEFDKAVLLPHAYEVLQPVVETMKEFPESRWIIEGHTDAIGSDAYNMELSRMRTNAVVDYLVSQGIERSRFEIVPLGESRPKATNDTQEGRAMNRRVEIKLIEESVENNNE